MASSRSVWPIVSRFSRPQTSSVRTWSPPESPLRIEVPPALLREVRIAGATVDAFGLLYGARHGNTIRLVSTRGQAGLEPLGIFASRVRGAVFLAEEDLERFEKAEAQVALVIAAETGGFFVRDAAGFIETVRSYEEFSVHPAPRPVADPVIRRLVRRAWPWRWAVCLPFALALLFLLPHRATPPLALHVSEDAGQLRISWNVPTDEKLTIIDGGERTFIPIVREQSTVTYARRTGDVTLGIGSAQVRFVGAELPSSETERTRAVIAKLESRIASLRAAQKWGQKRIRTLERRLQ